MKPRSITEMEGVMSWIMFLLKDMLKSYLLVPQNETLFGNGLYRFNHVKMMLLGWALLQYDWWPYKKGKSGYRHAQTEDNLKTKGEDSCVTGHEVSIYKSGNPKDWEQIPEGRTGKEGFFSGAVRERVLPTPWFHTSSLQNYENKFLF